MQKFIQINPIEAEPMKRSEFYLLSGKTSFTAQDDEPGYVFKDFEGRVVWQPASIFEKNHTVLPDNEETTLPIMKFFDFKHLPEKLQEISLPFYNIAHTLNIQLPDGLEKSTGLRKLLEAKDCMVRAAL